jgi:2-methylcitrate dehydratase PrpD
VTVMGDLASFVTGAKASALPAGEQARLRLHLTDTAMAALAGPRIPEGKALVALSGDGSLADRIGRQAAAIRLTEIDDIHLPSCVTPSAGVVPVALALAAHEKTFEPETVASALWAGTELATRIGLAVGGPQILYRGIWPTYLAAPVAAAATAARLMGLDQARTAHALSLAVMLMAGGVGRIHGAPSGRWFLYAKAVAGGVAAAEAARADYHGDPEILDEDWLADTHGIALDRGPLTRPFGGKSVYATLTMKPFCSAKQGIAAVEAFRAMLPSVRPDAIAKVRVQVPRAYAGMISARADAGARQSTLVSVAHQIALAALAPEQLYDIDRSAPAAVSAEMAAFAGKVEVVADPGLDAFYPQHWPAEVAIESGVGVVRQRVVEAQGDPERPLNLADVEQKAHHVLDRLLTPAKVAEWLTLCRGGLDDRAGCERLASALSTN